MNDVITENVSMKRIRRFGMDRLYVNTADGSRIGWVDLGTGERVIELPAHAHSFERAVDECTSARSGPRTSPILANAERQLEELEDSTYHACPSPPGEAHESCAPVACPARGVDDTWLDLAKNLPGQASRSQAIAAQGSKPVSTWLARAGGARSDERAWRIREKGEELVAKELAKLGRHWHVLHAVPMGGEGSDIDHLLIGPAGVLALNGKHHKNAVVWVGGNVVMVEGHRQPYVHNSRREARHVGRLLSATCGLPVVARGVVVPVNVRSITIWEQPDDVHVVNQRRLCHWLLSLPPVLDPARVESIFAAARRSSTWTPK
jgi:hypothetical protein